MNELASVFYEKNTDLVNRLIECLDVVASRIDNLESITDEVASDTIYMLDVYIEALKGTQERQLYSFRRLEPVVDDAFDELEVINELESIKQVIPILLRLSREKLIAEKEASVDKDLYNVLIEKHYCERIEINGIEGVFYAISDKGNSALCNTRTAQLIKNYINTAVLPVRFMKKPVDWDGLYVRRVELINRYFRIFRKNTEYIVFTMEDDAELVLGCEISDNLPVTYVLPGLFYEEIEEYAKQIKNLSISGVIDELIIVVENEDVINKLNGLGITSNGLTVSFEMIEREQA